MIRLCHAGDLFFTLSPPLKNDILVEVPALGTPEQTVVGSPKAEVSLFIPLGTKTLSYVCLCH